MFGTLPVDKIRAKEKAEGRAEGIANTLHTVKDSKNTVLQIWRSNDLETQKVIREVLTSRTAENNDYNNVLSIIDADANKDSRTTAPQSPHRRRRKHTNHS